jgi:hypothetical protein
MKPFNYPGLKQFVSTFDMCNLFNVYHDDTLPNQTDASYSINKTITFNNLAKTPAIYFNKYTCRASDCWTLISYQAYGTCELAWLILKVNGIANPFKEPYEFGEIRLLKSQYINSVLTQLRQG